MKTKNYPPATPSRSDGGRGKSKARESGFTPLEIQRSNLKSLLMIKKEKKAQSEKIKSLMGFTLIEILLVIGIIAILASVVIVAINPARQFAQARNSQRWSNINTILNGVHQYAVDNTGTLPTTIASSTCATVSTNEICRTGAASCASLVDLSVLTNSETYLVSMPFDPSATSTYGAGYRVAKSGNGRVTVCAPGAELGATISVTR